jgi:hypothetical protein
MVPQVWLKILLFMGGGVSPFDSKDFVELESLLLYPFVNRKSFRY